MMLSIVSPIYKGEKMLYELVSRIENSVEAFTKNYEIILVNDCSPDDSWTKMLEISSKDKKVKCLNLSRNFGQHYAITAGLLKSKGDWVVIMDCDLQDRPEEIPRLYNKALEGYDSVFAQRTVRQDKFLKKLSSSAFHYFWKLLTGRSSDKTVANFGIYNRKVIDAVLSMGDSIRNFPAMVAWVGFRKAYLPVQHDARGEGESGYNLFKLLVHSGNTIVNFSNQPLLWVLKLGFIVVLISLALALYYFICYFVGTKEPDGFTTMAISIWLVGGLLMFVIGVVGIYISKIFERVKGRPIYIVADEVNFED